MMKYIKEIKIFKEKWNWGTLSRNKILDIIKIGNPILRTKCSDIKLGPNNEIPPDIKELVENMFETIWGIGVGLAAPQIGKNINLFVIKPNIAYKEVFINPKIISKSSETKYSTEGCLSIPNRRGRVLRSKSVKVEYINLNGKKIIKEFSGFDAVIIQHEHDHLNGILFIDKLI